MGTSDDNGAGIVGDPDPNESDKERGAHRDSKKMEDPDGEEGDQISLHEHLERQERKDIVRDTIRDITRNDDQRLMVINGIPIHFTPLEYRVMLALTAHMSAVVPFATLANAASFPGQEPCSRLALERHIDRMRKKLYACSVEIRGVSSYGCVLIWSPARVS